MSLASGKPFNVARDATVAGVTSQLVTANAQLVTGVPPAVTGLAGSAVLLQAPGGSPYVITTMAAAGRLWSAQIGLSIVTSSGFVPATTAIYAKIYTSGGSVLVIAQCAVGAADDKDSANPVVSYPGKRLGAGVSILLDVNNAAAVTNAVITASALVEVSTP